MTKAKTTVEAAGATSRRSISVFVSGSRILIHWDDRFSGQDVCPDCEFNPCRINCYYRGPIEDCKLYRKTDPESLHEIVDYRPDAADDPATVLPGEDQRRGELERLQRRAEELRHAGAPAEAAEALRQAVRHASDVDAQLALVTRAARLMIQAGDQQGAYGLLRLSEDKVADARDDRVLRRFEAAALAVEEELGGYVAPEVRALRTPYARTLADIYRRLRRGPGTDREELRALIDHIGEQLTRAGEDGLDLAWWRRRLLSLCQALGEPGLAERWLARLPEGTGPSLDLDVVRARLCGYLGDPAEACRRFRDLLPRMRRVEPLERRLEYYGDNLEALRHGDEGEPRLLRLAAAVRDLFRQLLSEQPGAQSRRRFRERQQRTLEVSLQALLHAARRRDTEDAVRQDLLTEAWRLLMAARHPELQAPRPPLSDAAARRLRLLEDTLHRGLSHMLCGASLHWQHTEIPRWLQRVVDFELSEVQHRRRPEAEVAVPPSDGVSVTFFHFRELEPAGPLLVLAHRDGRFQEHWIDEAREVLEPLDGWRHHTLGWRLFHGGRGDGMRCAAPEAFASRNLVLDDNAPPALVHRKPDLVALRAIASRLFPAGSRAPSGPWYLFPEGTLTHLPLEVLPGPWEDEHLFETVTVRHLLRSTGVTNAADPRLDLRRGWLGVGDVPGAGLFPDLPATRDEVQGIAALLRDAGCTAVELLSGEEAHLENLTERLRSRPPAVLHLATHGYANPDYPDACVVLLALEPGGAAGELLPARLIRDLPLDGVELVVLSACSGLVGPQQMGTEGLAWAFLDAGVPRVLASRCPVGDVPTSRLMLHVYRRLLELPVAEALRQARADALAEPEIHLGDVGAWCLWE